MIASGAIVHVFPSDYYAKSLAMLIRIWHFPSYFFVQNYITTDLLFSFWIPHCVSLWNNLDSSQHYYYIKNYYYDI